MLGLPHQAIADFSGGFELLLMRMEALHLDLGDVKRLEITVFHDLAAACTNCDSKDRCEHDFGVRVGRHNPRELGEGLSKYSDSERNEGVALVWGRLAKRVLIGRDVG